MEYLCNSTADIVKFVTTAYIPLPEKWGDVLLDHKDAADGKLETIVIKEKTATVDGVDGDISKVFL